MTKTKVGCSSILIAFVALCAIVGIIIGLLYRYSPTTVLENMKEWNDRVKPDTTTTVIAEDVDTDSIFLYNEDISIPFTVGEKDNFMRIIIDVNETPMMFIVDTRSPGIQLGRIELEYLNRLGRVDYTGGDSITLKEIKIGDTVLRDMRAVISRDSSATAVLGQDIFRTLGVLKIDYNNNKIIICK